MARSGGVERASSDLGEGPRQREGSVRSRFGGKRFDWSKPGQPGPTPTVVAGHMDQMDPSTRLAARAEERAAVIRARIEAARRARQDGEQNVHGEDGGSDVPAESRDVFEDKTIDFPGQEVVPTPAPDPAQAEDEGVNNTAGEEDDEQSRDAETSSEEEEETTLQDSKDMEEKLFGLRNRRVGPEERVLRPPPPEELMGVEEDMDTSPLQGTKASQTTKNKTGTPLNAAEETILTPKLAANPTSFLRRGQGKTASSAHMVASPPRAKPSPPTLKVGKAGNASKRRLAGLSGKQARLQPPKGITGVVKDDAGSDRVQASKKSSAEGIAVQTATPTVEPANPTFEERDSTKVEHATPGSAHVNSAIKNSPSAQGEGGDAHLKDSKGITDDPADWMLTLDEALEEISKALDLLQKGFAQTRAVLRNHLGLKQKTQKGSSDGTQDQA